MTEQYTYENLGGGRTRVLRYADNWLRSEVNYKEYSRSGVSKRWNEQGVLIQEAHYQEDKLHGVYREYYDDGRLKKECEYKDNIKHGREREYHILCKSNEYFLNVERHYKNGLLYGISKSWYSDGMGGGVEVENHYKDGKKHGKCKRWWYNGQLWEEENYVEGKQEGVSRSYDFNGVKMSERKWNEGKYWVEEKVIPGHWEKA